jgi:hypothetical protein
VVGGMRQWAGVVADLRDRCGEIEAGATVGSGRTRASNDGGACLAPGSTELLTTRCYPPPKHKDNNSPQAPDIAQQSFAGAHARETVCARSSKSGSASTRETTSTSTRVAAFDDAARVRAREARGRDAARDVGRAGDGSRNSRRHRCPRAPSARSTIRIASGIACGSRRR